MKERCDQTVSNHKFSWRRTMILIVWSRVIFDRPKIECISIIACSYWFLFWTLFTIGKQQRRLKHCAFFYFFKKWKSDTVLIMKLLHLLQKERKCTYIFFPKGLWLSIMSSFLPQIFFFNILLRLVQFKKKIAKLTPLIFIFVYEVSKFIYITFLKTK